MEYTLAHRVLPTWRRLSLDPGQSWKTSAPTALRVGGITALHHHDFFEIGVCLSGRAVTHVGNRVYETAAGDLIWVPAYRPHLSAAMPGEPNMWRWFYFLPVGLFEDAGLRAADGMEPFLRGGFAGVFHREEHPTLAGLIDRFAETADRLNGRPDDPLDRCALAFLVGEMILEAARIGSEPDDGEGGFSTRILPALHAIRENYADPDALREETLAALCHVSPSYLRLLFLRETGLSPRAFISSTRLNAAAWALSQTSAPILTIALDCGFGQSSCFNRAFRRQFGMTPGEYRKAVRPSENLY